MLIPPQARKAWAAALRSGEYRQGHVGLENVADGVPVLAAPRGNWVWFDGESSGLPPKVQEWLGCSVDPMLSGFSAIDRNDSKNQSFAEIADAIDAEWGHSC